MNPNSKHQMWSKWVWFVKPSRNLMWTFTEVKMNCARFGRKAFGTASQMRIRQTARGFIIEVMTEGFPVHDAEATKRMQFNWETFFLSGFGLGTTVKVTTKLMAGSRQDGTPSDQMIIIPPLAIN